MAKKLLQSIPNKADFRSFMDELLSSGVDPINETSSRRWEGDGFVIRATHGSIGVLKLTPDGAELFHSAYGPSLVTRAGDPSYALEGIFMPKEMWEKDPVVREAILQRALGEILDE